MSNIFLDIDHNKILFHYMNAPLLGLEYRPKIITIALNCHGSEYNLPNYELQKRLQTQMEYDDETIETIADNVRVLSLVGENGSVAMGDRASCAEKQDIESYLEIASRYFYPEGETSTTPTYEILQHLAEEYKSVYETTVMREYEMVEDINDLSDFEHIIRSLNYGESLQLVGSSYDKHYNFSDTSKEFKLFGLHLVNIRNYPEFETEISIVPILDERKNYRANLLNEEKKQKMLGFADESIREKVEQLLNKILIEKDVFLSEIITLFHLLGFDVINIIDLSCRSNWFGEKVDGRINSREINARDRENAKRHNRAFGKPVTKRKKTIKNKKKKQKQRQITKRRRKIGGTGGSPLPPPRP